MKKYLFIFAFVLGLATSCGTASLSSITPNVSFDGYRYFYVINTEQLTSGSGGVYGGNGTGVWGSSSTKSVNPSDVINGYMMKKGFIRLAEIKPEIGDQTLLIAYGESGRHPNILGYRQKSPFSSSMQKPTRSLPLSPVTEWEIQRLTTFAKPF